MTGERLASASPTALSALCAALLLSHQVAAKTLRDALFLSHLPSSELPKVMLAAALVGVPAVLASASGMARFGPARFVPGLLVASALLHAVEWRLLPAAPRQTAVLVYLHVSVLGAIGISGFWSIVNERFDPHEARRAVGVISGGAGIGGLLGGVLAERVSSRLGLAGLLVTLFGAALLGAIATSLLGASPSGAPAEPRSRSGVRSLTGSPYLRSLTMLVVATGFAIALADYVFKATTSATFRSTPELVRIFTAFYVATSVVTVILQLAVTKPLLDGVGLGGTLAVLPAAIVGCGAVAVIVPRLWAVTLLFGAATIFQNSLHRSAYELLYTPLPPAQKRSVKGIIDVAGGRVGEIVASGLVLGLLALRGDLVGSLGLGAAVLSAALCLRLSMRIKEGYVSELAASLRKGSVRLDASRVEDRTTRLTLSQTAAGMDRTELLRQIDLVRQRAEAPTRSSTPPPSPDVTADLCSGDLAKIRAVLGALPLDPRHASLVLPLLEDDALAKDAVTALTSIGTKITGQLVDALLDPDSPPKVRRRLPRVLRSCGSSRAVRGLADALTDPDFEVRHRAALALRDLLAQNRHLRVATQLVFEAATRELERDGAESTSAPPPSNESTERARDEDRCLSHVFALLGLALDPEALELAKRALAKNDVMLRGTALEYLENVVPDELRALLWPRLEARASEPVGPASRRSTRELVDELRRSMG